MATSRHRHRLTLCHDCDGVGLRGGDGALCDTCNGRGYFEICEVCREPMGNQRRRWKREQRSSTPS